jgi:hypothetical protein
MEKNVCVEEQASTHLAGEDAIRRLKVYWVQTFEPYYPETLNEVGLTSPALYSTREKAEQAAQAYNEEWNDVDKAQAVEVEVDKYTCS